ncbi:unnamed protein product [Rotaria sp. Silwood2]|nr:unnamed protein product [Rotaria sp. Silwood2]CAF4188356.1 unnamed protein product [Rotaria sp. Silwood2]CAF4239930.1 unnamed protein product [Rotaria sp. Silwood2]
MRKGKSKKCKASEDDDEEINQEEEEDEDDEEEEDDEDEESTNKRKKEISRKILLLMKLVKDVDEDEEEEDAPEDGFVEQTDIHDTTAADIYRAGRSKFPIAEDEMEEYLKQRYDPKSRGTHGDYDEYEDGEQIPDEITQQSLLPDVKSPNLWPVKCRIGEEKQTALLLMRKYLALENDEKALQIKSVVVKEGDRGYIYVEAFKSNHVKAACEDIPSLNVSNLQMLPIKGMTDILRVVRTTYGIKKGSWVCVKRGIYRDDLAKVE